MPLSATSRSRQHVTIRVTGQVHGVMFRRSAQRLAEGLGLTGYAHNNPDGSVTMEIEGEPEAVQDIVRWSRVGPANARVLHVEIEPGSLQYYTTFSTD